MKLIIPNSGITTLLKRLWGHLSKRRKRQFVLLTILMLISAAAEILSLGTLLPFIGILTAPDAAFRNKHVATFADAMGIHSASELIFPLTVGFIIAVIVSGAVRILLLRVSTKLAYASGADLSIQVYSRTLYQPYEVHVARNSSQIISGITVKVAQAVNVLYQMLTLVSSLVFIIAIASTLLIINPAVALIATLGFGSCYVMISMFYHKRLHAHSKRIAYEQTQVIKALQEGLGGIRDVLLDSTQAVFCNIYQKADQPLRQAKGDIIFLGGNPRFIMESIGMILIATLAYYLSQQPGGITEALPVLGALALGAQRMLPALQQGYAAWSSIVGDQASLLDTLNLLDQPLPKELLEAPPAPLAFSHSIDFKNVFFRYVSDGPLILNGLDLKIPKGSRVGFVGITGSGKSTALDLLMGLLSPTEGEVQVDGKSLEGSRSRAWQRAIAHVPQAIYLSDASIAENIAFGIPKELIDFERVKSAAQKAQISDFIEKSAGGYNTDVGERGVRLSGGQRQRIGIARALYKEASVLIFDEATSALDNSTEQSVMEAIEGLDKDLTIIIIAHRLTTVKHCDFILELQHGKVLHQGSYDQLLDRSPSFSKMTK